MMHAAQLRTEDDAKRLATAKARAARRGIVLHALEADDGGLLLVASQFALTKSFNSLDEAERWLDRIGA